MGVKAAFFHAATPYGSFCCFVSGESECLSHLHLHVATPLARVRVACGRRFWWSNVAYINNLVPWHQGETKECFYHAWYLADDMQVPG